MILRLDPALTGRPPHDHLLGWPARNAILVRVRQHVAVDVAQARSVLIVRWLFRLAQSGRSRRGGEEVEQRQLFRLAPREASPNTRRDLLEQVVVHKQRLAPRVVLQHRVPAVRSRGGRPGEHAHTNPPSGLTPSLSESQHRPAEDILVAVREPEPLRSARPVPRHEAFTHS